jgi:periplasmic protein TonB
MLPEPRSVSEVRPQESLESLSGCLVDGDPEQRTRERLVKRRALAISILFQSAILALLILVPLFGRTQRIALAYATPIPPYSHHRGALQNLTQRQHTHGQQNPCRFCAPLSIPHTIATHDDQSASRETDDAPPGLGDNIPGSIDGNIPLSDPRQRLLPPPNAERQTHPQIVHITTLDPAMLIRRVEPVYPSLAIQTHREGRVEMRAIIGTDGSIQSLQVVSGHPLFLASAREAIQQWRYKPTYLNGQPVEIDTFITVVFTLHN